MSARVWGLYDSVDDCWLGTNEAGDGPKTFTDFALGQLAEHVARIQLGYPAGRLFVQVYGGGADKPKDELPLRYDTALVLDHLEHGTSLRRPRRRSA